MQSITENCVFVLQKFISSVKKRKNVENKLFKKFSTWIILKFQPNHRKVSIEFGFQGFNLWTILSIRWMLLKWSIDINTILQNLAQFLTIHTVKHGYQIGTHTNSVLITRCKRSAHDNCGNIFHDRSWNRRLSAIERPHSLRINSKLMPNFTTKAPLLTIEHMFMRTF